MLFSQPRPLYLCVGACLAPYSHSNVPFKGDKLVSHLTSSQMLSRQAHMRRKLNYKCSRDAPQLSSLNWTGFGDQTIDPSVWRDQRDVAQVFMLAAVEPPGSNLNLWGSAYPSIKGVSNDTAIDKLILIVWEKAFKNLSKLFEAYPSKKML